MSMKEPGHQILKVPAVIEPLKEIPVVIPNTTCTVKLANSACHAAAISPVQPTLDFGNIPRMAQTSVGIERDDYLPLIPKTPMEEQRTPSRKQKWMRIIRMQLNSMRAQEQKLQQQRGHRTTNSTVASEIEKSRSGHLFVRRDVERPSSGDERSKDDSPTRVLIKRTAVSTQSLRINSGGLSAADQELNDSPTGMLTPSAVSHDSSNGLTSRHSGSAWIKRTANVRGRISSFWRQAALAALRNQSRANQSHVDRRPANASLSILEELFRESWPTASQVELWQESFQNLLQDEDGLRVFREFLRGEFSDENIEFWVACQQYKALKVGNTSKDQAQRIYDTFIAFQSQREVNLDCETRLQTESRLAEAGPDLFDACQKRIEALMEKDPYIRFLRSALYYKLKEVTGVSAVVTSHPTGVQDCGNPDKSASLSPPRCDASPSLSVPQNSLPPEQTASSHLTDEASVAVLNNGAFPDVPYSPLLDAIVVHFPCSTSATSLGRKSKEKYRPNRHSLDLSDIVSK